MKKAKRFVINALIITEQKWIGKIFLNLFSLIGLRSTHLKTLPQEHSNKFKNFDVFILTAKNKKHVLDLVKKARQKIPAIKIIYVAVKEQPRVEARLRKQGVSVLLRWKKNYVFNAFTGLIKTLKASREAYQKHRQFL